MSSFEVFDKSLIYSKNNRGPRMDPWGTPQVIERESELWPFIHTNCSLLDRYEWNQSYRLYLSPRNDSVLISVYINKNATAKLIVVNWVTDWFSNLYQCMICRALLPKAKLIWIKNVTRFKIAIKALKHSLFKNFTKNR